MTLLVLGLILWTVVHVFKRVAPDARAAAITRSMTRYDSRDGGGPRRCASSAIRTWSAAASASE